MRFYIYRYSKIHKSVTKRDACYNADPSRWFRFLTIITNTTIAEKINRNEFLTLNLQQCFEKALRLEASLKLSEGFNMAQKTTIMNVNVEDDDEVNLIKDARARSNACYKCGEVGHFQGDGKYDGDRPAEEGQVFFDSYDPVIGKWMTNLVSTTPITAKAIKSLYAELNQQKDLKWSYRRKYKDLQAVVTMTTDPHTMSQQPVVVTNSKASASPPILKTALGGQGKKLGGKGKSVKPTDKEKKHVVIPTPGTVTSAGPSSNLRSKLHDKSKVTAGMIQELTEELQAVDQESVNDEQCSEAIQESDLEQEDSKTYMTDNEEK